MNDKSIPTDTDVEDLITVSIAVTLNGNNRDKDVAFASEFGCGLSCSDNDAIGTIEFLRELAEAIENERAFAWLQTQIAKTQIGAGEWNRSDPQEP